MRIQESNVLLTSQWSRTRQHSAKETIQFWNQEQNQSTKENVLVDISEEGKALLREGSIEGAEFPDDTYQVELTDRDKEKIRLLEDFIFVLTGKKVKFLIPRKIKLDMERLEELKNTGQGQNQVVRTQGWGFRYEYHEFTRESEKMSFASKGTVTTADGRVINFSLNFNVSREFIERTNISIRAGDALIDPLVINFKNASATLGDRNYSFDIDCDGENDIISFTGYGSGFLVLDKNGNNEIDDGSELFGPQSGNGFGELAAYDEDGNGWIDENDEIFNKLRIWTLDENGEKTLLALGVAGVGAIYLGNVQSEFGLKTQTNETLGQIRKTGIFLKETGEVGTIQHVDLAI